MMGGFSAPDINDTSTREDMMAALSDHIPEDIVNSIIHKGIQRTKLDNVFDEDLLPRFDRDVTAACNAIDSDPTVYRKNVNGDRAFPLLSPKE